MSCSHPNNSAISAQSQLDYIEASIVLQKLVHGLLADTSNYEILSVFAIAGKPTVDSNTFARKIDCLSFWATRRMMSNTQSSNYKCINYFELAASH
jgi:hypothetical protein